MRYMALGYYSVVIYLVLTTERNSGIIGAKRRVVRVLDKRVVLVKCKCGKEVLYGNGGVRRFRKNGEARCFDCDMRKYDRIIIDEKIEDTIDNEKEMC